MKEVQEVKGLIAAKGCGVRCTGITNGVRLVLDNGIKTNVDLSVPEARHLARCLNSLAKKVSQA